MAMQDTQPYNRIHSKRNKGALTEREREALFGESKDSQESELVEEEEKKRRREVENGESSPTGRYEVVKRLHHKNPLFASLAAKARGKDVGIPQWEGAATIKSPWNAPELFDLSVLEGESLREWLFVDKPRRAFESGNRKQRSLPDYSSGRGWHESRKQVLEEFGGLKRSYYIDPQPSNHFEWHLFEYEISNCVLCALYRLQFKLTDHKKGSRAKPNVDLLVDLQQQMGKLSAKNFSDKKRHGKGRAKANHDNTECVQNELIPTINGSPIYGPHLPYAYSMDGFNNNYYGSNLK